MSRIMAGSSRLDARSIAVVVLAGTAAGNAPFASAIELRANQPLPDAAVVTLAKIGEPTVLSKADYPDAARFSARQVVTVLCGSYRESYWQETLNANDRRAIA